MAYAVFYEQKGEIKIMQNRGVHNLNKNLNYVTHKLLTWYITVMHKVAQVRVILSFILMLIYFPKAISIFL